eukprot:16279088-Heterocapsa_arctica.AAC.1
MQQRCAPATSPPSGRCPGAQRLGGAAPRDSPRASPASPFRRAPFLSDSDTGPSCGGGCLQRHRVFARG